MPDWLLDSYQNGVEVSLPVLLVRLGAALGLGAVVAGIYRVTRGRAQGQAAGLTATLVLLTVLIAMVTLVLGCSPMMEEMMIAPDAGTTTPKPEVDASVDAGAADAAPDAGSEADAGARDAASVGVIMVDVQEVFVEIAATRNLDQVIAICRNFVNGNGCCRCNKTVPAVVAVQGSATT